MYSQDSVPMFLCSVSDFSFHKSTLFGVSLSNPHSAVTGYVYMHCAHQPRLGPDPNNISMITSTRLYIVAVRDFITLG